MKKTTRTILLICALLFLVPVANVSAQVLADGESSVLKEDKTQSSYVYDLKLLIKKSKENIKDVNEKIKEQAILKRNQKREEKAREYYEQAQKLTAEGRLDEARELFDKAIRITEHPEMKYYIKESVQRSKEQVNALKEQEADQERRLTEDERMSLDRVEISYQSAVSLYKQQKLQEARTDFEAVEEMYPDYKAVRSYLQIIDQDLAQTEHKAMKEQKKEVERQQKEAEIARLREKELWRKEIEKKEQARQEQLRQQADAVYAEALKLYQQNKFLEAKEKFQEVEWVVPDFKGTRAYLNRIDQDVELDKKRVLKDREKDLEKQRWQETLDQKKTEEERQKALQAKEKERLEQMKDQAEFVYVAAVALFEKDLPAQAREKFEEVERLYPDYKQTRAYLKRMDDLNADREKREAALKRTAEEQKIWEEESARRKAEKEEFNKRTEDADRLFNEASDLYKMGRLIEAKEKFLAVDEKVPDYKSCRNQLKRIDEDIDLLVKSRKHDEAIADQKAELEQLKQKKEQADKLYNEALGLYDIKEFEAARRKFAEVSEIFPEYKKTGIYLQRIDDDIKRDLELKARQAREKEVESIYAQAVALYNKEQYEEAKKKFIEVETLVPNYKLTAQYCNRVDDDILHKKEQQLVRLREIQIEGPYNQAVAFYQNADFEAAKAKFLEVTAVYPDYKDTAKYLDRIDSDIERQKKEQEEQIRTREAEGVYLQAVSLYQGGDFESAKEKFIKTEVVYPDYKDTAKYLARIDGDIAEKKKKDERDRQIAGAEPLYLQAVSLYKELDFYEAKKKFVQAQAVCPGYKDIHLYLSRIDADIRKREERIAREEKNRKSEALYAQAVSLYAERKFEEAKVKLIETSGVDPDYRNIRSYLARIDKDIRDEADRRNKQRLETLAEAPYAEAVDLYHTGEFEAAKAKFIEVVKLVPDYKKTKTYLSKVDLDIREQARTAEKNRMAQVDALYQEALSLQNQKKHVEAFEKFSALESLYPDYKATRKNMDALKPALLEAGVDVNLIASKAKAITLAAPSIKPAEREILDLYKDAVSLYKEKKYEEALVKFEAVESRSSNYRSTAKYLKAIRDVSAGKESLPAAPAVQAQTATTAKASDYEAKVVQADPLYAEGMALYQAGQYAEAKLKFEAVDKIIKGYKSTDMYFQMIASAQGKTAVEGVSFPVSSDKKDAAVVRGLAARSEAIYRQIKTLSQDKDMAGTARTFAQVDRIMANLEAEQRRMEEEVERRKKQEEARAAQDVHRIKAAETQKDKDVEDQEKLRRLEAQKKEQDARAEQEEKLRLEKEKADELYQQASDAFRAKDFKTAKEKLNNIESIFPGYKDVPRFLMRVERALDEADLMAAESNDRAEIARVAEQASALNMEILKLSQERNFEAIEQKFSDLEGLLRQIRSLKDGMQKRRDDWKTKWENRVSRPTVKQDPKSFKGIEGLTPDTEGRMPKDQSRVLFRQGQQLYNTRNYPEARVKFLESGKLDPTFRAPMTYVARIDRLIASRDFEDQQTEKKQALRSLEKKQEMKEGLVAETPQDQQMALRDRARKLMDDGRDLYDAKRYRESRVKFEELCQIGDPGQKNKALRYIGLIEQALAQERLKVDRERSSQEQRFMMERLDQLRIAQEKDRREQLKQQQIVQATDKATVRELEIKRQQDLRAIEAANLKERQKMIDDKGALEQTASKKDAVERGKVAVLAGKEKMNKADVVRPVDKKPEVISARKKIKTEATTAIEKKDELPQPVSYEAGKDVAKMRVAQRQLAREDEKRRRLEESQREALLREKTAEAERLRKEELLRRQRDPEGKKAEGASQTVKPVAVPVVKVEKVVSVEKVKTQEPALAPETKTAVPAETRVSSEKDAYFLQAAAEEKRVLAQQREAIRKDFEAGVERIYNEAVDLFKQRKYDEAYQSFLQVNEMIKGYKKTDSYIKQSEKALKKTPVLPLPTEPQAVPQTPSITQAVSVVPDASRSKAVSSVLDMYDPNAAK